MCKDKARYQSSSKMVFSHADETEQQTFQSKVKVFVEIELTCSKDYNKFYGLKIHCVLTHYMMLCGVRKKYEAINLCSSKIQLAVIWMKSNEMGLWVKMKNTFEYKGEQIDILQGKITSWTQI